MVLPLQAILGTHTQVKDSTLLRKPSSREPAAFSGAGLRRPEASRRPNRQATGSGPETRASKGRVGLSVRAFPQNWAFPLVCQLHSTTNYKNGTLKTDRPMCQNQNQNSLRSWPWPWPSERNPYGLLLSDPCFSDAHLPWEKRASFF